MRWAGRIATAVLVALAGGVGAPGAAAAQDGPADPVEVPPEGAQPAGADTLELTLAGALRLALDGNPAYRRAANQLALDGPESRNRWANEILPSATVQVLNTGYTGNLTRRATDNFGNPIADPTSDWSYFSDTQQSLSLDWRIQGWNLVHARRENEQNAEERALGAEVAAWTLRSDVRRDFFDVLEQRDLLALERDVLDSRRRDHEAARRLFELTETSRVDVLRAELAIEQQMLEIQRRRGAYEQALVMLRTRIGIEDLPPLRLAEEPLPIFDPGVLDADALVSTALEANPDLRRSRTAREGAELGVARARESWWPELRARYSIGRVAQDTLTRALLDFDHQPEDLSSRFELSVGFPLLNDFFGNRLREAEARVRMRDAREDLREAELTAEREVRSRLIDLRNAWESLRMERRSLEIAVEAVELARQEYRLGARSFDELQADVDAEADARRRVVEARHAFVDALVGLEEAVGAPVAPPAG